MYKTRIQAYIKRVPRLITVIWVDMRFVTVWTEAITGGTRFDLLSGWHRSTTGTDTVTYRLYARK